jgi:hypothetical protein
VVACSTWESDRTLYYQCPDCATKFNLMGEPLTDKAS